MPARSRKCCIFEGRWQAGRRRTSGPAASRAPPPPVPAPPARAAAPSGGTPPHPPPPAEHPGRPAAAHCVPACRREWRPQGWQLGWGMSSQEAVATKARPGSTAQAAQSQQKRRSDKGALGRADAPPSAPPRAGDGPPPAATLPRFPAAPARHPAPPPRCAGAPPTPAEPANAGHAEHITCQIHSIHFPFS